MKVQERRFFVNFFPLEAAAQRSPNKSDRICSGQICPARFVPARFVPASFFPGKMFLGNTFSDQMLPGIFSGRIFRPARFFWLGFCQASFFCPFSFRAYFSWPDFSDQYFFLTNFFSDQKLFPPKLFLVEVQTSFLLSLRLFYSDLF